MRPALLRGHVDTGLGKEPAVGTMGILTPTVTIDRTPQEMELDGVRFVFQHAPESEATAELTFYLPDAKVYCGGEIVSRNLHNIYTLRGALVRDALEWSKQINVALYKYGQQAEVMFASHHWPRWGNQRIQEVMRAQRDAYAHLNNEVLHLANQAVTINEVHNVYEQPAALQRQWAARSYHGSEQHNSRAIINRYLGYCDANP